MTRQTGGGKTIDFVYDENNQPLAMKYNGTLYYSFSMRRVMSSVLSTATSAIPTLLGAR